MGASGVAVADTLHYLEGKPGRHGGRPPAHLHADFYRLHDLLQRSSNLGGMLDVPLHARLAMDDDRDANGDEFLGLLGQRPFGKGRLLHFLKGPINLSIVLRFNCIEAIKQSVMLGAGIAVLPHIAVKRELAEGLLVELP
jgi:DNA-binding transcriptional LysR family regulator